MRVRQHWDVLLPGVYGLFGADGGQTYIISPSPLGIVVNYAAGVSH